MFEYIRLKNFKSFGDIEFNLLDKKGNPKKLILLYGENGIGKSNFTRMFKRVTSLTPKNYREQGISDKLWDKPYFIRQT